MKPIKAMTFALAGALSLFAASQAKAACDPAGLATKYPTLVGKTIIMGLDPETPPYATRDPKNFNKFVGSDIELAKAVFVCEGLKYEFRPGAWSGLLPAVNAGQISLMYYLYYSPERAKQVDFINYMKAGDGALVQVGNPKNIRSEADLCGKTVVAGLGTVEEAQLRTLSPKCVSEGKGAIDIMTASDSASGMRLVANKRADVDLDDLVYVDTMVAQQPKLLFRAYSVIADTKIGVAIKKGNDPLRNAIFDGLTSVQAAGGQLAIFKTYGLSTDLIIPPTVMTK
ncbi:ABC transporter substrate-binding protein [Acidisoma cladoniae]|uniref:ABC transporter substrate-binding protein n=1 Tax=Acidisoma cladoniae TaxID=3040935 RepID=UPI0025519690|nr:ABC transporter substrate-binding protein [Acidisoma sp. PAMC 29798]